MGAERCPDGHLRLRKHDDVGEKAWSEQENYLEFGDISDQNWQDAMSTSADQSNTEEHCFDVHDENRTCWQGERTVFYTTHPGTFHGYAHKNHVFMQLWMYMAAIRRLLGQPDGEVTTNGTSGSTLDGDGELTLTSTTSGGEVYCWVEKPDPGASGPTGETDLPMGVPIRKFGAEGNSRSMRGGGKCEDGSQPPDALYEWVLGNWSQEATEEEGGAGARYYNEEPHGGTVGTLTYSCGGSSDSADTSDIVAFDADLKGEGLPDEYEESPGWYIPVGCRVKVNLDVRPAGLADTFGVFPGEEDMYEPTQSWRGFIATHGSLTVWDSPEGGNQLGGEELMWGWWRDTQQWKWVYLGLPPETVYLQREDSSSGWVNVEITVADFWRHWDDAPTASDRINTGNLSVVGLSWQRYEDDSHQNLPLYSYEDTESATNEPMPCTKMYPGRTGPDDTATCRNKVRLLARLSQTVPDGVEADVHFRLFDVDDPSAHDNVVDDDSGEKHNDNRPDGSFGASPAESTVTVQSGDTAELEVSITEMQPGNNWRVTAGCAGSEVDAVHVDSNDGFVLRDGDGNRALQTRVLTIWRKLWVELDMMEEVLKIEDHPETNVLFGELQRVQYLDGEDRTELKVEGVPREFSEDGHFDDGWIEILGSFYDVESFTDTSGADEVYVSGNITGQASEGDVYGLYDDDYRLDDGQMVLQLEDPPFGVQYPWGWPRDPDPSLLAEAFEPAYVTIETFEEARDDQGNELNGAADFVRNLDDEWSAAHEACEEVTPHVAQDFWGVHLVSFFQGHYKHDTDGDEDGGAEMGEADRGGERAGVHWEVLRDNGGETEAQVCSAHEVGHCCGLEDANLNENHPNVCVMNQDLEHRDFCPACIDKIRDGETW